MIHFRKFVAFLMLLWLPLSSSAALAATVSMQTQHSGCHEVMLPEMHNTDAAKHQHHDTETTSVLDQTVSNDDGASCNSCGACHLSCSGYLAVSAVAAPELQVSRL